MTDRVNCTCSLNPLRQVEPCPVHTPANQKLRQGIARALRDSGGWDDKLATDRILRVLGAGGPWAEAAIDAAIEANRGWHSDVGPHNFIIPFLRSLGLDDLADAVQADKERRY